MKTKVKRMSKRTLALLLGVLMLITSIGMGSLITANAVVNWYDYGGNNHHYIYYDDSTANISAGGTKNVYAMMGYSGGSNVFQMTRVSPNALLYRLDYDNKWEGCAGFGVKGATSTPSGAVTTADRYTTSGNFNGNATVFAYGSKTGTTLTANAWTANKGDEKTSIKNNVTLSTKVDTSGSGTYLTTSTSYATLSLKSHYWNGEIVSSAGAASGFANGSVTYGDAVGAAQIEFSYSNVTSGYSFKGWYDSNGNKLSDDDTYTGYQQGHVSAITYYAYFQKQSTTYSGVKAAVSATPSRANVATVTPANGTSVVSTTGQQVTYTLSDNHYQFVNWTASNGTFGSVGGDTSTTDATPKFYPTADNATATANFKETTYNVTIKSNGKSDSTITPGYYTSKSTNAPGSKTGYSFTGWKVTSGGPVTYNSTSYSNGETISAEGAISVTASAAATLTAQYSINSYALSYTNATNQHTFSVKVDGNNVSSGSNVEYNKTVYVTVDGATGTDYKYFIDSVTGQVLSDVTGTNTEQLSGTFTMPDRAVSLAATSKKAYKVTIDDSDVGISSITVRQGSSSGAIVSSGDYVLTGTTLWVSATAKSGYRVGTYSPALTDSTFTLSSATTISATSVVTHNVKYIKKGDGSASSVKINGTSKNSNTDVAVDDGSNVTFIATAASGSTFCGWYSDADCTTLLESNTTYTVSNVKADLTVYPCFTYSDYYLCGTLCLADWGNEHINPSSNIPSDNTTYHFTQSESDPRLYTYTDDFRFATFVGQDKTYTIKQYVTVSNGTNAYSTASADAASGTAASGFSYMAEGSVGSTNKWLCDAGVDNDYKKVTFTWNAVTKELSWTMTSIDYSDYITMYVDASDSRIWEYMWIDGGSAVYRGFPGIQILCTPYVTIESKVYNIVLVKNSRLEDGQTLSCILSNGNSGSGNQSADITGLQQGGSYKITYTTSGTPEEFSPTEYAVNLSTTTNGFGTAAESDHNTATRNATVTITTHQTNNTNYIAFVTVTDASSKAVEVTKVNATTYTFTMPSSAVNVNVEYAQKREHTISVRTNDGTLGSLSLSPASPYYTGDVVTVTINPATKASYKDDTLSVTYNDGANTVATSGSDKTYTFTMPDEDVVVYAEFEEYTADADFWYDGYQRLAASGANAGKLTLQTAGNLQFTEAMYNGNKYAYVKVTRSDLDPNADGLQEFVVKTSLDATFTSGGSSSGGIAGTFYFLRPNWDTWSKQSPRATFYSDTNGTTLISGPTNLGWVEDRANSTKLFKINVPIGTKSLRLDNGNSGGSLKSTLISGTLLTGGGVELKDDAPTAKEFSSGKSDQGVDINKTDSSSGESQSSTGSIWQYSTSVSTDAQSKKYKYISNDTNYSPITLSDFVSSSPSGNFASHSQIIDPKSYYVVILYPENDYGKLYDDKSSVGSENNYRVYATTRLPGEEDPTVNFWAKDGVIRIYNASTGIFGTTSVTESDYVDVTAENQVYNFPSNKPSHINSAVWQAKEQWDEGTATKGQSITVSTVIGDDYKSDYYVKGFSFNGVTPELYSWRADGTYTCTYTIPSDFKGSKLEITPIYFLKDDSNTITFYLDGYSDALKEVWGNTLYVYPFYQQHVDGTSSGAYTPLSGQAANFRAYPGQPVINYGGRRYIQIPLTDDGTASGYRVKGVTINNGYWDQIHGDTRGSGDGHDNDDTKGADFVNVHRQTYDYDDFYKIYNENGKNGEKNLNSIYFTFKYQTTDQHRGSYNSDGSGTRTDQNADNAATLTSENKGSHTWEMLKNNFNKPVDLFGTKLSDADLTTYENKEMYVISEGYEANNAGKFATEWAIYKRNGDSYTKVTVSGGKTSIVPSVLAIVSSDRINATEYPQLDGDLATTDYKAIYEALEEYRGVPVYISYEAELHGGTKSDGYDPAERSDGRWTFTRTTDYIKANVKIEYMNEKLGVNSYIEDEFDGDTHIGQNTGASAYFTFNNETENGYAASYDGKTSITNVAIQDNKYFSFKAETAGSYEFMGWYSVDMNGEYHQVNNDDLYKVTGHSPMSTDSTFVARFKYVANGSLTISHTLASGNAGRGTTYIGVYVNGAQIADENSNTDSVKLDKTYIGSNKRSNIIQVVLKTTATGENTFNEYTAKKTDDNTNITNVSSSDGEYGLFNGTTTGASTASATRTITFKVDDLFDATATQKVLALSYYSALNKPINRYVITYNYSARDNTAKAYTVKGEFTDSELKSYIDGSAASKAFKSNATQFFSDKAPHESNFQKTLQWTLNSMNDVTLSNWATTTEGGVNVYTVTASVNSTQTENVDRRAVFDVPYETNEAEQNYTAKVVDGKVAMLADDAHETFELATKYGKWFENIDTTNFETNYVNNDESDKLIIAPETIVKTETDTTMYFSYWKVSTLTNNSKAGKYITKCYYPRFNYVAYDNYYIEAIYSESNSESYSNLIADANLMDASIAFLEDSRNQWNNKDKGESNDSNDALDKIYNDFALSFKYKGLKLSDYNGDGTNDVRLGMVIQRLGEIDMSEGDHIGTLDSYEAKYRSSVEGTVTKIQSSLPNPKWSNGVWANITDEATSLRYPSFNHVIATNNETFDGVEKIASGLIDNKNRTEYYFSLENSMGQNADLTAKNEYSNKNYVYRAFSYIMVKINGTWTAKVSETPAYFCIYDRATRVK